MITNENDDCDVMLICWQGQELNEYNQNTWHVILKKINIKTACYKKYGYISQI